MPMNCVSLQILLAIFQQYISDVMLLFIAYDAHLLQSLLV